MKMIDKFFYIYTILEISNSNTVVKIKVGHSKVVNPLMSIKFIIIYYTTNKILYYILIPVLSHGRYTAKRVEGHTGRWLGTLRLAFQVPMSPLRM